MILFGPIIVAALTGNHDCSMWLTLCRHTLPFLVDWLKHCKQGHPDVFLRLLPELLRILDMYGNTHYRSALLHLLCTFEWMKEAQPKARVARCGSVRVGRCQFWPRP